MAKEQAVAYQIEFDYQTVRERGINSLKYVGKQIETHLGERLNTLLSTYRLEIKDKSIFGQDMDEPFLTTLRRGQKYRETFGNLIDRKREQAEVVGFEKIEEKLTALDTKVGSMMLSVSPRGDRGSNYNHNFYDIFTLAEDDNGRFIEARRYSSALTPLETVKRLKEYKLNNLPFPNDVSLLANPIFIEKDRGNADDIHLLLHERHNYIEPLDFYYLKLAIEPSISAYKEALLTGDQDFIAMAFNTLLRQTDKLCDELKDTSNKDAVVVKYITAGIPTRDYIKREGIKPVRQVMTGCGSSGGIILKGSPFSVSEFGSKVRNYEFDQSGPCRLCGEDVPCGPCKICQSCDDKIQVEKTSGAE